MLKIMYESKEPAFRWLDLAAPTRLELETLAENFNLHPSSVIDCLDAEHLPKIERIGSTLFMILRGFDEECSMEADTIQELTRKVAVFVGEDFFITVHRQDSRKIDQLHAELKKSLADSQITGSSFLVTRLMELMVLSFDSPLSKLERSLEKFESAVFVQGANLDLISVYFMRRKVLVFKRMLRMLLDVVARYPVKNEKNAPLFQNVKEEGESVYFYAEELYEDLNSLLDVNLSMASLQTNLASQKTNEVLRVLTVISLFFLPLNFIVGIYGMNFKYMPELQWKYGYVFVHGLILLTVGVIYFWFRRKGWLHRDARYK